MIRQNELMNVRCSERGSLLGIKIYSPSSECLIECVDIPEQEEPRALFITFYLINRGKKAFDREHYSRKG